MNISTTTLGYPRIGKDREVKKSLEAFWSGKLAAEPLLQVVREVEAANWRSQLDAGIDRLGIGDMTLYDPVLDWSVRLGLIPERFRHLSGLEQYFAMARGTDGIPALEMTKWFDTNYHYLMPEITSEPLPANFSDFLETVRRAQVVLGERAIPIALGPMTLLRLSRLEVPISQVMAQLSDHYVALLIELKNLGIAEVQMHEPALVLGDAANWKNAFESTYHALAQVGLPLHLVTGYQSSKRGVMICSTSSPTVGVAGETFKTHFVPRRGLAAFLNAWLAAPDTVILRHHFMNAHILEAVDTYNPAVEAVVLLESFNQVTFFYLKNLPITPPQCYEQVCREWVEFQPQATQLSCEKVRQT